MIDLFLVYSFIRKLVTPFNKWEAFKLGIIDEKGEVLIKRKEFTTREQRKAFGIFDVMLLNMKKLLAKAPGGSSRLASYAAGLWLIKEWNAFQKDSDSLLTEDLDDDIIERSAQQFVDEYLPLFEAKIKDEDINMTAGSGAIAGIGIGPDGEPGVSKAAQKKHKKKNKLMTRTA